MSEVKIPTNYKPLDAVSLIKFIKNNRSLKEIIKGQKNFKVTEVGDGNLNLVFFADSEEISICVKQPLPYVRVLKDWPLTLKRSYFEYEYMNVHSDHVGHLMPAIYDYDENLCTISMEKLSPHIIMRKGMIEGIEYLNFTDHITDYLSKTLFFTSDLYLNANDKRKSIVVFSDNTELCKITEDLVFTEPYIVSERNRWTKPYLDERKTEIEKNTDLKIAVNRLKLLFLTKTESLLHGDLHTGSIMCTPEDTKIIDPEFAFYGPMGFDIGALLANLLISFFSQNGHEIQKGDRSKYKLWILNTINKVWNDFEKKFLILWQENQNGDAYSEKFFELSEKFKVENERKIFLKKLFHDSIGFAAAKMIRRLFGFAHNIDLEWIKDEKVRAECENKCSALAIKMMVKASEYTSIESLTEDANKFNLDD
jgi:5-methylthioribose kinase